MRGEAMAGIDACVTLVSCNPVDQSTGHNMWTEITRWKVGGRWDSVQHSVNLELSARCGRLAVGHQVRNRRRDELNRIAPFPGEGGKVRNRRCPSRSPRLAKVRSPPIADLQRGH